MVFWSTKAEVEKDAGAGAARIMVGLGFRSSGLALFLDRRCNASIASNLYNHRQTIDTSGPDQINKACGRIVYTERERLLPERRFHFA